jgi:hypothetical protein
LYSTYVPRDTREEVVLVGDGRAILMADNLAPAPEGNVYQAWLMRSGVPEPAGLSEPRDEGTVASPIEGSLQGADTIAVARQPPGCSSTPTSDIMLTATL